MTTVMDRMEKLEDRYFEQLKEIEQPILDLTEDVADRTARFVPERPGMFSELPTMGELIENQLKFQKRLVDEQARFTRKMLKAMGPVVARVDARPETKAQATKTRTTKSRTTK